MKGFVQDIEGIAIKNADICQVLYMAKNFQFVVMALEPRGEIETEATLGRRGFRICA
jgi:hypothetical protein